MSHYPPAAATAATAGTAAVASTAWPVAVLLFSSSMWGLSWLPLKGFAMHGLSGPALALLTYGAIGLVGLPWLWRERPAWRRQTGLLALIALLGGWGNAAFVSAIVLGDVVRVMLLFYLVPVWSVIGGRLFLGEAVSPRRAGSVVLALSGAFLVVGGTAVLRTPLSAADLLAITAGIGFAGNNIASRAAQSVPTVSKTVALCLGCGALSLVMLLAAGSDRPAMPAPTAWLGLTLAAYTFGWLLLVTATWQWAVTRLEAGRAGVIAIAELLVALVSASLIGGERMTLAEWLGAALIGTAALLEALDATPAATQAAA